jgi:SAM-dependent methyltransferase
MADWPTVGDTSAMAENYASYLVPSVVNVWTIETLQHIQARPEDTVLDVACGTGALTFEVAQLVGPYGRVVGVDIDRGMLGIAERIRKIGGSTLKSIGHIARTQRVLDNDAEYVDPLDMLAELREDNKMLAARLREVHDVCDEHRDIATASLIEVWIDETERRTWFLSETVATE